MNRGDWAEIYVILYAILNEKVHLGNEYEECLESCLEIKNIKLERNKNEYSFRKENEYIKVYVNGVFKEKFTKEYILSIIESIYNEIVVEHNRSKNIYVKKAQELLDRIFEFEKFKEVNKKKHDAKINTNKGELSVNIKSNIYNPPTFLNPSEATKIAYKISSIPKSEIEKINLINSNQKIIDRVQYIYKNYDIIPYGVIDKTFKETLITLDKEFESLLSRMLIYSYLYKRKEIEFLTEKIYKGDTSKKEKVKDLLNELSFNIIPSVSKRFNIERVNGFLYMKRNGEVLYYEADKNETKELMYKQLKLETPSANNFDMCRLTCMGDGAIFYLYIQLRMIKKNNK